jgi:monofunctional biosynthetic peptidoglycan transglycosylase
MIEWIWGKKRILEVYLNVIEMGKGIYGVQAAAENYFKKDAAKLTRKQAALITACFPNPVKYTVKPLSPFVAFKSRWILRQMGNVEGNKEIKKLITTAPAANTIQKK